MIAFLVFLCIGHSIATTDVNKSEPLAASNGKTILEPEQQQFEVFSLNSYDSQMPLIIRSRLPDSLRPSNADFRNDDRNDANFRNSFIQSQLSPQLTLPLPYSVDSYFNSNANQDSLVQNIASIPELNHFLYSDNAFGVGLMSLEVKAPAIAEPSIVTKSQPNGPTHLIPAHLTYSTIFKVNNQTDDESESSIEEIAAPQDFQKKKSSGYTIEQVPEIASYNRTGPLTDSDIPSYDELETIFNSTPSATLVKSNDVVNQPLELRSGIPSEDRIVVENDREPNNVSTNTSAEFYNETTTSISVDESVITLETVTTEEELTVESTIAPELTIWDFIAGKNITSVESRLDLKSDDDIIVENGTSKETQTTTENASNGDLEIDVELTTLESKATDSTVLLSTQTSTLEPVDELESNVV